MRVSIRLGPACIPFTGCEGLRGRGSGDENKIVED